MLWDGDQVPEASRMWGDSCTIAFIGHKHGDTVEVYEEEDGDLQDIRSWHLAMA